jgi:predicted DNA binding CopG/RHH family protein
MTKKKLDEAEKAFTEKFHSDTAAIERKALEVLSGTRQVTLRLNNSEIELAKQQAKEKGLPYQTYIKMLLHQALVADGR